MSIFSYHLVRSSLSAQLTSGRTSCQHCWATGHNTKTCIFISSFRLHPKQMWLIGTLRWASRVLVGRQIDTDLHANFNSFEGVLIFQILRKKLELSYWRHRLQKPITTFHWVMPLCFFNPIWNILIPSWPIWMLRIQCWSRSLNKSARISSSHPLWFIDVIEATFAILRLMEFDVINGLLSSRSQGWPKMFIDTPEPTYHLIPVLIKSLASKILLQTKIGLLPASTSRNVALGKCRGL